MPLLRSYPAAIVARLRPERGNPATNCDADAANPPKNLRCQIGKIYDAKKIGNNSILTRNPLIKAADGLRRIWFSTDAPDYWPITYTSFWLEWWLWGASPLGYHLTNLALHLVEVFLVWAILARLKIPGARWAALLFAVHPINVESVAWIAQRKNLTAMLFLLTSIGCFIKADIERPPAPNALFSRGSRRWYALAFLAFVAAMLGKGSVVILPGLLVVLIAYHRRLTWADVVRLAPFVAAAAMFTAVNVWFQFHGSGEVVRADGFVGRLLGAAAAIWFYLGKTLAPFDLCFVYPRWEIQPTDVMWWLPLVAGLALTGLLWSRRRDRGRGVWCSWAFFVIALLPVLGFADIYFMRYSLVADHYAHVALLGVVTFVAAAWSRWHASAPAKIARISLSAAAFVVAIFALLTFRQAATYRDSTTLWRSTLDRNPQCWLALTILGNEVADAGNAPAALAYQERALRLNPESFEVQYNFANVLGKLGRGAEAIPHYQKSLALRPNDAAAHYGLGKALHITGDRIAAIVEYRRALVLDPKLVEAHNNLGIALVATGDVPAALRQFATAIELEPGSATSHYNLGHTLHSTGNIAAAIEHYTTALRLKPDYFEAEHNLALALGQHGAVADAIDHYRRALKLNPTDVATHNQLGVALLAAERTSEALAEFHAALGLAPENAETEANLGLGYAKLNRHPEAISHYEQALRLQPKSPSVNCNLASSLLALNRLPEAVTQLEHALELDPSIAEAHYNLALIDRALGKSREATDHYTRARQLKPDLPAW